MKRIKLNLGIEDPPKKLKRVKRIFKKLLPVVSAVAVLTFLALILTTFSSTTSVVNFITTGGNLRSTDGKVNILLLGMAGGTHAGATLTDTILVASYNLRNNQVFLISIPRDLWLPSLQAKANAVYQIGFSQGEGLPFAKTITGNILGLPIHYGLRVDFKGFVSAVDILGGLDIEVERSFDDYNFPIEGKENDLCGWEEKEIDFSEEEAKKLNIEPGKRKVLVDLSGKIATDSAEEKAGLKYFPCRFEHIAFKKGPNNMDGNQALKYVRSRSGTNGEASDFSRSKRQQKVLQAAKVKILSLDTLTSPQKITELIKTFGQSIETDIQPTSAWEFLKLVKRLDRISNLVLDDSERAGLKEGRTSLLVHPQASDYGGAYVLVSQDDDFSAIQEYVKKVLSGEIKEDEATPSSRTSN